MKTALRIPTDRVRLDSDRLAHELARRGITARAFCAIANVPEVTFSLARHGRRIRPATLKKIVAALTAIPVIAGVDAVLPDPPGNSHSPETKTTTRLYSDGRRGGHARGHQSQA